LQTVLTYESSNTDENVLQHKVNEVMNKLEYLFEKNNLMRDVGKTVAMSFHTIDFL
jgi:hypothetical protein